MTMKPQEIGDVSYCTVPIHMTNAQVMVWAADHVELGLAGDARLACIHE